MQAQNLAEGFSTFSADSNEPIDVNSDKLRILDGEKTAIFSGNVIAVQGEFSLQALELKVLYSGELRSESQSPSSGTQGQIKSINAKGKIVMKSGQDQTANSDWVIFDVPNNLVTIGGNVVLKQGNNTLTGDTLIIDLKSGKSRFEKGRVRGRFVPVAARKPR
ncbi:MAG: LptA/OstA family protein [Methyloligellaceae bacterium]